MCVSDAKPVGVASWIARWSLATSSGGLTRHLTVLLLHHQRAAIHDLTGLGQLLTGAAAHCAQLGGGDPDTNCWLGLSLVQKRYGYYY